MLDGIMTRAEANAANAQHSTGPRSANGKARSSTNALRHGLTAKQVLAPGELAEDLRAF